MKIDSKLFKKIICLCLLVISFSLYANKNISQSPLLLAKVYQADIQLENYWVSEKYDGVRAYWNGKNFISRQGNVFHAPEWFKQSLPKYALDGELWLGRGKFAALSGLVRRKSPNNHHWKKVKYMIFDLPDHKGIFDERLKKLKEVVAGKGTVFTLNPNAPYGYVEQRLLLQVM